MLLIVFLVLTIMLNLRYINSGLFNTENGVFSQFFAQKCVYRNLRELTE